MPDPLPDLLLGQIALERKMITQEQLDACLAAQDEAARHGLTVYPLGSLLVALGYVHLAQLEELVDEQTERMGSPVDLEGMRREDALFGKLAVKHALCTETHVNLALRLQARMHQDTRMPVPLGELLVVKGYMTPEDVSKVLRMQVRTVMACASCGAKFTAANPSRSKKYTCRTCGGELRRAEEQAPAGEEPAGDGVVQAPAPDVPTVPATRLAPQAAAPVRPGAAVAAGRSTHAPAPVSRAAAAEVPPDSVAPAAEKTPRPAGTGRAAARESKATPARPGHGKAPAVAPPPTEEKPHPADDAKKAAPEKPPPPPRPARPSRPVRRVRRP